MLPRPLLCLPQRVLCEGLSGRRHQGPSPPCGVEAGGPQAGRPLGLPSIPGVRGVGVKTPRLVAGSAREPGVPAGWTGEGGLGAGA